MSTPRELSVVELLIAIEGWAPSPGERDETIPAGARGTVVNVSDDGAWLTIEAGRHLVEARTSDVRVLISAPAG